MFKQKALKQQNIFVVFAEICLEKRFKNMLYTILSSHTKFQKQNYKEKLNTKQWLNGYTASITKTLVSGSIPGRSTQSL